MILVYATTPIHVGAGRSVGIVDLPIQRDAIGYPVIFSSSFKGALKAYCARNHIKGDGRIDCPDPSQASGSAKPNLEKLKIALCCCAFGSEPLDSPSETGILTVTDLIPFAVPVPAEKDVYLYLTSPYLLRKISDILQAEGFNKGSSDEKLEAFKQLVSSILDALNKSQNNKISISDSTYIFVEDEVKKVSVIDKELEKIFNVLSSLGNLASNIKEKLVLMPNGDDRYLFDKATVKVTRNRISLDTKTVAEGALWTEEYLPEGTIFFGGYLVSNNRVNKYCEFYKNSQKPKEGEKSEINVSQIVEKLKQECFSDGEFYFSLGGKETIGKGLVKVRWL